MIEVFKTNVEKENQADTLIRELNQHFPDAKINFDLEDCDKILRIEGLNFLAERVTGLLQENGFTCLILD